jgi:membrane dipeptidase
MLTTLNYKKLIIHLIAILAFTPSAYSQRYKKLHQKALVIDTHNDAMIRILEGYKLEYDNIGKTHSDLERFKKGGVDAQFFSIWCDEKYGKGTAFNYANLQIDTLYAEVARNADKMTLVRTPKELSAAAKKKKLAALIGVEGGHMIEDNLTYLDSLFKRGTRYMTLTWNNSTSWATSAADESKGNVANGKKGLNDFGKQVVRRMNELGMMVDLSHVGEQTFWDAMSITQKPVLVSHSGVYSLCPVPRNLKDDQIKAVAKNGGVIQINFFSGFLDSTFNRKQAAMIARHKAEVDSLKKLNKSNVEVEFWFAQNYPREIEDVRPPFAILFNHIDYLVKLVGVDYVGLGSDFDGVTSTPMLLDDVSTYPIITQELLKRGYSKKDIKKILGENLLRVFRANMHD